MIKENIKISDVISFLNSLIEIDEIAINKLVSNRVSCNEKLANHPTVQVWKKTTGFEVGILGILNGMFGIFDIGEREGWGCISAEFDDNTGKLKKFVRLEVK